eukprot:TRINITY_DN95676_c0_g1_i1.p1 TRINITY_DN95676_c0_g1~~TRINITY_DN95676_c0_g1_i1.p1  ORF type:complete len:249 (+),score=40.50 TRINITY_DN95676_c0_g1_i1:85-831(+)
MPATIESKQAPRRRTARRSVTWQEVDGACASILEFQAREASQGDVFFEHEESSQNIPLEPTGGRSSSGSSCFAGCGLLTSLVPSLGNSQDSELVMSGYVWKLGHHHEDKPGDIFSWRRRLALVRKSPTETAFVYISEKDDGHAHVSCLLSQQGQPGSVKVQEEPTIEFSLSDEAMREVASQIHTYDIAFAEELGMDYERCQDYYTKEVPQKLYPFSMSQGDKQALWAVTNEDDLEYWLRKLRQHIDGE